MQLRDTELTVEAFCDVAGSGYHWLHTKEFPNEREDLFLTPEQPGSQEARSYRPLEAEPALFRIFADTEPTKDGIQELPTNMGL